MNNSRSIVIDNRQINPSVVQEAFLSAKADHKQHQVVSQTFRMMNLNKLYESNPGDPAVKMAIKTIADSNFLPKHSAEEQQFTASFDLNKLHPLNKLGNFGRVLTRKCRIVQKGLMEYTEDNQEPKLKELSSFTNRIQGYGFPQNDKRIQWLQEHKKYPYRLVVVDKNDSHKGIYFRTYEEAQSVRIVFSQKYIFSGNLLNLVAMFNKEYLDQTAELFRNRLVARHKMNKMMQKSMRNSRNPSMVQSKVNESNISKAFSNLCPEPSPTPTIKGEYYGNNTNDNTRNNASVFDFHNTNDRSNARVTTGTADVLRYTGMLQNNSAGSSYGQQLPRQFEKVNDAYMINLIESWLRKAKVKASAISRNTVTPVRPQSQLGQSPYAAVNSIYKSRMQSRMQSLGTVTVSKQESPLNNDPLQPAHMNYMASQYRPKQSNIRQELPEHSSKDQLRFYSIEFMTITSLFFKPIITIQLHRDGKIEQSIIYNTVIVKKSPHLVYDLVKSNQEQQMRMAAPLRQYEIAVKVIDFLANQEVINDKITMKNKTVIKKNTILCDHKMVKLTFGPSFTEAELVEEPGAVEERKQQLRIPPLAETVKDKIQQHWEKESQYQGYYNQTNLSIYKVLTQIQIQPLTWWKGLSSQTYQLLHVVYCASKIIGFRMIRSFKPLLKAFVTLYPDLQQMTENILSFILTLMRVYYFPEHFNRIQKFHRLLGLDQECQLISKINVELMVIEKIIEVQCPTLVAKINRSNLCYGYKMMQYIYQAFSRNFTPNFLVELWNFLYQDVELLQLYMVLICVTLIKYYEEQLLKTKRLVDFARILESKKLAKMSLITSSIDSLKQKYFGQVRGLLDQIKNIFHSRPLEPVLAEFYQKQTAKLDKRKHNRLSEKKAALKKVNKQIQIAFPEYKSQNYTLHIFFSKLPEVPGNLVIRCNDVDYECLNLEKNRYFIIGEVRNTLTLSFVDLKSNEYSEQLILNQGIHEHSVYLTSPRSNSHYKVSYIAGLLTDYQIEMSKKGKKFDHFLSPFIKEAQFRQEMGRPLQQAFFLRKYDSGSNRDDLVKKIKTLFCSGSKTFNEIQFYIQQIQTSELTIEEKVYFVKTLAQQLSQQFCLCQNSILEKHFIRYFIESTGFDITSRQYQCFYTDSLEYEFDAPKIVKCRYHPHALPNKELKLEVEAINYYIHKAHNYLYPDIIIDDLMNALKPAIQKQLNGFHEGDLKLYYSSNGDVLLKTWHLKLKPKSKDIYYEQIKQTTVEELESKQIGEPEVLMTQILPSFAKISTILDYVNTNRNLDLRVKYQDNSHKKMAENINILKEYQSKFNKIIMMRYLSHPEKINFPFFNYYYELIHEPAPLALKDIVLNNLKTDIKALCLFPGVLKFGQNAKVQSFVYNDQLGLYGNLRLMSKDAKGWFFFGSAKDDYEQKKQQARVFINYGYGIFRWQPCQILGYYKRFKSTKGTRSPSPKLKQSQMVPVKEYLIIRRNQDKLAREYELQVSPDTLSRVKEIVDSVGGSYRGEHSRVSEEEVGSPLRYLSKFIK